MRRAASVTAGICAGMMLQACGSSDKSRTVEPSDAGDGGPGDKSSSSGGASGKGGAGGAGAGGLVGAGGKATGGAATIDAGSGGAIANGGTDSGTGGAVVDASKPDANTKTDAGARCVDAGAPDCAWLVTPADAGTGLLNSATMKFEVNVHPDLQVATASLDVYVCECDTYATLCVDQPSVPVTVNGDVLTADLSSLATGYSTNWIQSFILTLTTKCGGSLAVQINNNGTFSPYACTDDVSLSTCSIYAP